MSKQGDDYSLVQDNIVPFYLVEDKLKNNFNTISKFIEHQEEVNHRTKNNITHAHENHQSFKIEIGQKLKQLEKKIVQQISQELEGRIVLAINKNLSSFAARMEQKQQQIANLNSNIDQKLQAMKKNVLFEGAKQSQKNITKEMQKMEKKLKNMVSQSVSKQPVTVASNKSSTVKVQKKESSKDLPDAPQNYFTQEWVHRIKQLEEKTAKTQQFLVGFDKRFYDNMSALKDSWKQLGQDMLATKKKLTTKQDQLRLQLVKVRGIKEFQGAPEEVEQNFKNKIMTKLTDIYQFFGQLVPKTDFDGETDRIKKTLARHNEQLNDVRGEMAKNNEYFTFYANNTDNQDLSAKIKELQQIATKQESTRKLEDQKLLKLSQSLKNQIQELNSQVLIQKENNKKVEGNLSRLRQQHLKSEQRLEALQEHNNFTPQKMAKIHDMLDVQFSPTEQELIAKKNSDFGHNQAMKELRGQLSKLKDQLFILNHQYAQIDKVKKSVTGLEGKVDKIKIDSEEAVLSRKPWVCLSCDKNQKEKHDQEKVKRDLSRKKLQEAKSLFTKDKSEKLIKLIPTGEEKFQVYEKYRQKYMSEGVKLPDIYKEKIGEKQPNLN